MGKKSITKKERRLKKFELEFYEKWKELLIELINYPRVNEDVKKGLEDALEYVNERIEEVKKQARLFP